MTASGKLRALAASARLANLPSVLGNVGVGVVIAWCATGNVRLDAAPALAMAAGASLYLSGNLLNDWWDLRWDSEHRPERALPRGFFRPGEFLGMAAGLAALGLGLAVLVSRGCLLTAACIVPAILVYTAAHKRTPLAVLCVAFCRALLPVLGFAAVAPLTAALEPVSLVLLVPACAALMGYVTALSLDARWESAPSPPRFARWAAFGLFAAALGVTRPVLSLWPLAALPCLFWLVLCHSVFRHPVSVRVSNLLAGIPLVDALTLLPLAHSELPAGQTPWLQALVTASPFACLLAGKLLQRLAPAT